MIPVLIGAALLAALAFESGGVHAGAGRGGGMRPANGGRVRSPARSGAGSRCGTRCSHRVTDPVLLLELVAAALRTGASIPRALIAVGEVGDAPSALRAGRLLLLGAGWDEAWEGSPDAVLVRALEPAWCDGANPLPLLERAAASIHARRDRRAREAAGRLGVRLVLPLGLCYLPAFIAIGVVPVLLSTGIALLGR